MSNAMAEWSNVQRAFLAGARYGYKRGYQDAERETRREVEGLMDQLEVGFRDDGFRILALRDAAGVWLFTRTVGS
jgi:hypothetical protein